MIWGASDAGACYAYPRKEKAKTDTGVRRSLLVGRCPVRTQFLGALCVMATVIAVVSLAPVRVAGQTPRANFVAADTWTPPRTPDGQPDLQGIWANNNATPLQRPEGLAGKQALTDEEVATLKERASQLFGDDAGDAAFGDSVFQAALAKAEDFTSRDAGTGDYNHFWLVERDFDNRTSLVVDPPDGRIPPLTPEGQQRADARRAARDTKLGPEDLSLATRCISFGVPRLSAGYNSYYQILQTPGYVVIFMETIHDARVIPLDGRPHISQNIRQWHGDPRGHWEGDTLVVDTTNYSPESYFRGSAENLHVVERFTRVGPRTINYEITVDDPTTWTSAWIAMIPLKKTEDSIFEYACHEGNTSMEGILRGARVQDKAAAEAATTGLR